MNMTVLLYRGNFKYLGSCLVGNYVPHVPARLHAATPVIKTISARSTERLPGFCGLILQQVISAKRPMAMPTCTRPVSVHFDWSFVRISSKTAAHPLQICVIRIDTLQKPAYLSGVATVDSLLSAQVAGVLELDFNAWNKSMYPWMQNKSFKWNSIKRSKHKITQGIKNYFQITTIWVPPIDIFIFLINVHKSTILF